MREEKQLRVKGDRIYFKEDGVWKVLTISKNNAVAIETAKKILRVKGHHTPPQRKNLVFQITQ